MKEPREAEAISAPLRPGSWAPRATRLRVSREGWYWLVTAGAMLLTGLFKGINLINLLSCLLLAFWGLNFVLARRQLRRLRGRRFLDEPVFAQTPYLVEVELTNRGRRPRACLRLEDGGPAHQAAWFVPLLAERASVRLQQEVTLPRRGRYAWGPLRALCGYPFGLLQRGVTLAPGEEIVVLPRLGQVQRGVLRRFLSQASPSQGQVRALPRRNPTAQAEFHGLRTFRSGDSPRWIHWRTTARRGELMVREFEELPTDDLVLVLDPWTADAAADPAGSAAILDEAIALTATICWEWCRQKGDRLVLAVAGPSPLVYDGVTGRPLARQMLEGLAVQSGCSAIDTDRLLRRLVEVAPSGAPVLVVSTRLSPLADDLSHRLHRPVACLNVADPECREFFWQAPGAGAPASGLPTTRAAASRSL
jgi:uncharacterized protein (DUF58 family)